MPSYPPIETEFSPVRVSRRIPVVKEAPTSAGNISAVKFSTPSTDSITKSVPSRWKAFLGNVKDAVPYATNLANIFRRAPMPAAPRLTSTVSAPRVSFDAQRAEVDRSIRGANLGFDMQLDGNTAAAAKAGMFAQGIREKNRLSQDEANTNAQLGFKTNAMNADIEAGNNALVNNYNNHLVERQMAQQRFQSENMADAANKFLTREQNNENLRAAKESEQNQLAVYSQLFKNSGVFGRLFRGASPNMTEEARKAVESATGYKAYGGRILAFGGSMTEDPPGKLKAYKGGKEATPTGKSNAFANNEFQLTDEALTAYAKKYNLPTNSNQAFQTAQLEMLSKSDAGKALLAKMDSTFGPTKAGRYDDGMLGARTRFLIENDVTQTGQQTTTPPAVRESFSGEPIYGSNNHLIGYSKWKNAGDNSSAEFMFADKMGKVDSTRGKFVIPGNEWSNRFTGGTRHLKTAPEDLNPYKMKAYGGSIRRKPFKRL